MDSSGIFQKLSHLIQIIERLAERADNCRSSCQHVASSVKLLKAPLDELHQSQRPVSFDVTSTFNMIELACINLKELMESCRGNVSKLILVLQKEQVFKELSVKLRSLLRSLPLDTLSLSRHSKDLVQECVVSLESLDSNIDDESLVKSIETSLSEIKKGTKLSHGTLLHLAGKLGLKSHQEILKEASLLEKEKNKAHKNKMRSEEELLNNLLVLITQMSDDLTEQKHLQAQEEGIPIPADFLCPLSLELMSDPVLVASGQTYERAYIQQWLEEGNTTCPKSRQTLNNFNLFSNVSVKALIASWCEQNGVTFPELNKFHKPATKIPLAQLNIVNTKPTDDTGPLSNSDRSDVSSSSRPVGRSMGTVQSRGEEPETIRESASEVGSLDEDTGILDGHVRASALEQPDRHFLVALERESSRDVTTANGAIGLHRDLQSGTDSEEREDGIQSRVQDLVGDLQSGSQDVQRMAATELRLLAKFNVENRIIIADSGAIPPLVTLLHSTDPQIQENAVTALLNLSINSNNKSEIACANAIGPLVHVLKVGTSEARENAAATLFSLSVMQDNKIAIGQSGAIDALVDLLVNGTPRGKKDAATALFNLSILPENKIRIVRAKAVQPLVGLMSDPAAGMIDKAAAVIMNLASIQEGRNSIGEEEGIPVLVEVVEMGSQRGKESAAAALFQLCSNSNRFRSRVLQEGAIPPLVALARSGTPRAREKASALLRLFREQRHSRGSGTQGDRRRH